MPSKICVVTGASSGIGKEIARGLALMGSTVVLACRDAARAEAAREELATTTRNPNVWPMALDLARIASIDAFVDELRRRFGRLDLLVNNAAAIWRKRKLTESGVEATFAVNHLGPFALTLGLLELLEASAPSRIVMVSSKLHVGGRLDLDDLRYDKRRYSGFAAYNASKLANVIFTRTLARRGDAALRRHLARRRGRRHRPLLPRLAPGAAFAARRRRRAARSPLVGLGGADPRRARRRPRRQRRRSTSRVGNSASHSVSLRRSRRDR